MTSEKLLFFLQDGASMSENLNHTLIRLKEDPANSDLVHQAFRYVHSIKSEASFLNLDAIAALAHEMEGYLDQVRRGAIQVSEGLIATLSGMVEQLEEMLFALEQEQASQGMVGDRSEHTDAGESDPAEEISLMDETTERSTSESPAERRAASGEVIQFSEFERRLLREAWERNERFFQVDCQIEESAPIKYAKAYLVLNNLEIVANVIRTSPPLEPPLEDERYQDFHVYVTAEASAQQIHDAVEVDQVERIRITELGLDTLAAKAPTEPAEEPRRRQTESHVRVEAAKLDEMLEYVQEMRLLVHRLRWTRSGEVDGLSALLPRLDGLLKELRTVPLERELRHLPRFARDLARSLGKRVRLAVAGGEILVDRRMLVLLADPLLHLVRNAVDHGIETPEERELLGKDQIGNVTVDATRSEDTLTIRVGDDGRGISEQEIVARARELGFLSQDEQWTKGGDMLPLLVRPGFSTRGEATSVSGRGVGLDLVFQKITGVLGGVLRLEANVGHGCTFTLELPAKSAYLTLLLARRRGLTVGIPARNVDSSVALENIVVEADGEGWLVVSGAPIYVLEGDNLERAHSSRRREEIMPSGCYLLFLNHLGTRSCIVVDELLFEQDVAEDQFVLEEEDDSRLCRAYIAGRLAEFRFLRPPVG